MLHLNHTVMLRNFVLFKMPYFININFIYPLLYQGTAVKKGYKFRSNMLQRSFTTSYCGDLLNIEIILNDYIIAAFRFATDVSGPTTKCYKVEENLVPKKESVMSNRSVLKFLQNEAQELLDWSKCGETTLSALPTLVWGVGSAVLSQRILEAVFRRFLFRRVPFWEIVLHNLLFMWMVVYSLHFWVFFVRVLIVVIEYIFDDKQLSLLDADVEGRKTLIQCVIWVIGVTPLAFYIQTRPRRDPPPLMIWIASNPWHRREMGPYGYYLNRPLTSLQSQTNVVVRKTSVISRRAFSDSKIVIKKPMKKKRIHSKSV